MENTNNLKPELSTKSKWYVPKDRYYELKYFCRMYPMYIRVRNDIYANSFNSAYIIRINSKTKKFCTRSELVEKAADISEKCSKKIDAINKAAVETDKELSDYIVKGITENLSYDVLKVRYNIPCSRGVYYELYREFFWHLDKLRD